MKKKYIVQKKEDFNEIIRTKKPYKNKYLSIYIRKSNLDYPNQILFKKSLDYIIIVRDGVKDQKYQIIETEVQEMFKYINQKEVDK